MTRRQLRRAVRWEAAIVASYGGLLGIVVGVVLGVVTTAALPETFAETISIPFGRLVTYLIVATVAGLFAAILPARRAGKMNVLEAIAHE